MTGWIEHAVEFAADAAGVSSLVVYPLAAVVLLGLTCGLIGSTVVGNRMAFFSDAMAHTSFAGVSLGILSIILLADVRSTRDADAYLWLVQPVMIGVGVLAGVAIVAVRERSGLTNDTVIGVFFALAIGVGAIVLPQVRQSVNVNPEDFLYGSPTLAQAGDLLYLLVTLAVTAGVLSWRYNAMALASFNPSLARSRGVTVRADHYLFVILLALIVNVAIRTVGILLINALLVVPAAAAANVARNQRQVFWFALVGTVGACVLGLEVSKNLVVPLGRGRALLLAPSGTIVVTCVAGFVASLAWATLRGRLDGRAGRANP